MKRLLVFLFLFSVFLVGCQKPVPIPKPQPTPPTPVVPVDPNAVALPSTVTEKHNGKTFLVKKGSTVTFVLKVNTSEEYFWAFSNLDGDFEVLTDTRSGVAQRLTLKVESSGKIGLQYCQFTPDGAKVLSNLAYGIQVN